MNKRKIITAVSALILIITVSAAAASAVNRQKSSSGKYYRDIIDRVCFTAENTEFVLSRQEQGDCEIVFSFSAKKTEADFYAVINSIDVEGVRYKTLTFINTSGSESYSPENTALPAENGEAKEISWEIRLTVSSAELAEVTPFYLAVDYTSGITQETSDEHLLRIPMRAVFD